MSNTDSLVFYTTLQSYVESFQHFQTSSFITFSKHRLIKYLVKTRCAQVQRRICCAKLQSFPIVEREEKLKFGPTGHKVENATALVSAEVFLSVVCEMFSVLEKWKYNLFH